MTAPFIECYDAHRCYIGGMSTETRTIRIDRAVVLEARRAQLRAEESEGHRPSLSEVFRRGLEALASRTAPTGRTS